MTLIEVIDKLGEPEKTREVYSGELELLYQNTIFASSTHDLWNARYQTLDP
jgi:hypothetical protein